MTDAALLLDKPVGLSSNAALQRAKRSFCAKKAGHAGTLDPLASGLLIVLFGEATKFAAPLLDDDKEYLATLRLGEKTATGDAEGEVIASGPVTVARELIADALARFLGITEQIPPMYSALKREGTPLYALARRGETVARSPRRVTISKLEAVRFEPPYLELRVRCSKGTYVRTLSEDIAAALGTVAHLSALRRTGSGGFRVDDACPLGVLEEMTTREREARLLPLGALLAGLPRAELDREAESRFRNGQALAHAGDEGLLAVYDVGGAVIGLGRGDGAHLHPVRLTVSQAAE
jgi:tRNA pseudouridine55 synthase